MEKTEFIQWLVADHKYPTKGAEFLYGEYLKADNLIKQALQNYKENQVIPHFEIEGYSVSNLQKGHHMNVIASLFTLDYLIKDPQKAKKSLNKGHDFISLGKSIQK